MLYKLKEKITLTVSTESALCALYKKKDLMARSQPVLCEGQINEENAAAQLISQSLTPPPPTPLIPLQRSKLLGHRFNSVPPKARVNCREYHCEIKSEDFKQ